ncbi:hypothetical protein BJ741DRAFT_619459, partial [Chytriomyces cf. hyalinus JEL632]
ECVLASLLKSLLLDSTLCLTCSSFSFSTSKFNTGGVSTSMFSGLLVLLAGDHTLIVSSTVSCGLVRMCTSSLGSSRNCSLGS